MAGIQSPDYTVSLPAAGNNGLLSGPSDAVATASAAETLGGTFSVAPPTQTFPSAPSLATSIAVPGSLSMPVTSSADLAVTSASDTPGSSLSSALPAPPSTTNSPANASASAPAGSSAPSAKHIAGGTIALICLTVFFLSLTTYCCWSNHRREKRRQGLRGADTSPPALPDPEPGLGTISAAAFREKLEPKGWKDPATWTSLRFLRPSSAHVQRSRERARRERESGTITWTGAQVQPGRWERFLPDRGERGTAAMREAPGSRQSGMGESRVDLLADQERRDRHEQNTGSARRDLGR